MKEKKKMIKLLSAISGLHCSQLLQSLERFFTFSAMLVNHQNVINIYSNCRYSEDDYLMHISQRKLKHICRHGYIANYQCNLMAIIYTSSNSQCLSVFYIVTTGSNLQCIPHLYLQVALVYQGDDPINFMTSFYGCLIAGIIPVPIEPPTDKDVSRILANTY